MEIVASRVDELGKSKIVPLLPQPPQPAPTTSRGPAKPRKKKAETKYPDWDIKQYKGTEEQRRKDRENRRLIREQKQKEKEAELAQKVKALQPLGDEDDEEEAEAPPEPDPPVPPPVPVKSTEPAESTAARNRRYEMERRRKDKVAHEAERAKAATQPNNPDPDPPKAKSPGRGKPSTKPQKGKSPARATKENEMPEVKSPARGKPSTKPKGKSPGRSSTGAKTPKAKEKPGDNNATDRGVAQPAKKSTTENVETDDVATSRKIPTRSTTQHVDDDNFELDLATGKFIKKKKKLVIHDDVDDDDIEMEEIDDEDRDKDYDPDKDADQGDDDDDEQAVEQEDEDDDFPIPPLRTKKSITKVSNKSSRKQKKQKTADEALGDLADFVETTFKKPTRQGARKARATAKEDACINPVEVAKFRQTMRDEAKNLEKAVQKGTNVPKAYETFITHVIQECRDMNYEIPSEISADDILLTIEDTTGCSDSRGRRNKHLKSR